MAKIKRLSPHVADLIAAGEVVERPASVIKELVENSIDAGASTITVEIKNGGMSYIRVTDNGCGMSKEDAETAFLRHATSKLYDERGLEAIGTLGFRGEALAAISAVSRVELLTRELGAAEGSCVTVEGGTVTESAPAGCPEGSTIIVRGLFFNTPARLKFMKADKAEGAACSSTVIRCALSNPQVSLRYIKDGKEELHTPGDGKADSCIYSVFGREFAAGMTACCGQGDNGISVSGFICSPAAARGSRSSQFFFCNGRYIKSKTLQAALEQAYANQLFTGRFPSCVLYLTLSNGSVDVNVHPAKTEVKFLNEKQVFDCVYYAVKSSLQRKADAVSIDLSSSTEKAMSAFGAPKAAPADIEPKPKANFFTSMSGDAFAKKYGYAAHIRSEVSTPAPIRDSYAEKYQTSLDMPASASVPPPAETKQPAADDWRIVGETQKTYILVERGESLWLIDKHAAHERMIFDKLKSQTYTPMSQELLEPVVCELAPDDVQALLSDMEQLEALGIQADAFGETAVAVRRLPWDMESGDARAAIEEICGILRTGALGDRYDSIRHTIACKAAIKAGKNTNPAELAGLVRAVLSGEVRYCPHGRPVAVELTKAALDKAFKRT